MSQRMDRSLPGFRMRPAVLQTARVCAFLLAAVILVAFVTAPAHGQVSVYTQNYDNGRSGSNNNETTLTPALLTATPTTFHKLFTLTLDSSVYTMPLILGGLNVPGEPTNILLVQTERRGTSGSDSTSLWAFNADTGTVLWQKSLGTTPGHTNASPVIDPTMGTDGAIYLVTYNNSLSQLHAIDPITGTELAGSPVTYAASAGGVSFNNSSQQNTRTALLLFKGVIYTGFAHSTDSGTYHGWVIGYKYTAGSGFTLSGAFCDTPSGNAGGIWQGGGGLIADSSSVYTATANGSFSANTGGSNYSMSVLRLTPPTLSVADWFAPSDEATMSNADQDLNGGGMTMIPGTTDIFLGPTKAGLMFLVNTTNLGHFQVSGPIQRFSGFGTAVGYNPISWNSGSGIFAYVWPSGDAINEFSYNTSTGQFSPAGAFKTSSFTGGGTLSISSNNGSNGILWATGSSELHAMNPADVSAPDYWNSNMSSGDAMGASGGQYQFSTVANGKIYVATTAATIVVYGTTGPPPPPPNPPTNLAATAASSSEIDLSWTASTTSGVTYSIFRSTTSGFTAGSGNQIASGVSGTAFSDTGLTASTTYFYLVQAVLSGVSSSSSNQASATTLAAASCTTVPSAPTGLTGTAASSSQINLSWTASTAGTGCSITYSVFRSTTSGFTAGSGNQIASGVTSTTYSDLGLAASTTYFYLVEGVDSSGSSAASNQASATTQASTTGTQLIAINSGGPAVSPFVADTDFTGGTTIDHANTINTSKVTNPAPAAVYQSGRDTSAVGPGTTFSYTIGGFTAGTDYLVRLHFCETFFTAAGKRTFNVSINGTQVLTDFDIFAAAGGQNIANIQQFTEPANASGQFVILFTSEVNNALISGIEIDSTTAPPPPTGVEINSGGPAVSPFVADEDFTGGATIDHANTINTSKVTNPAPAAVYQSARVTTAVGPGTTFTYTIGGFTANSSHTVRLHFCETFWTAAGKRLFNVSINGTQVLTNFDIFATAGGQNIANIQQFTEAADSTGTYTLVFTSNTDKALISGIEID
jgi:Malectin domain/PQQ-like domain